MAQEERAASKVVGVERVGDLLLTGQGKAGWRTICGNCAPYSQPLVDISPWGGLFGPARVPRDVVDRISRDFNVVMRRADVVEQFDKLGMLPLPSTPDELTKVVKSQLDVFSRAIRDSGMQQE